MGLVIGYRKSSTFKMKMQASLLIVCRGRIMKSILEKKNTTLPGQAEVGGVLGEQCVKSSLRGREGKEKTHVF